MGALIFPRIANRRKPSQFAHPLYKASIWQGCKFCWSMTQGGGAWRIWATPLRLRPTEYSSYTTSFNWQPSEHGMVFNKTNSMNVEVLNSNLTGNEWSVKDFSVSALIRLATGHGTSVERVFSHQSGASTPYWGMVINNNRLTALSSADSIVYPGGYGASLADNKWHRLDVVRDTRAAKFNYYVDGALVQATTIASTASMVVTTEPPRIGGYSAGGGESLVGAISDLWVWNRARSQAEVQDHYQNPYKGFYSRRLMLNGAGITAGAYSGDMFATMAG